MKSTKGQEFCGVGKSGRYQRPILVGETKNPKGILGATYRGAGKRSGQGLAEGLVQRTSSYLCSLVSGTGRQMRLETPMGLCSDNGSATLALCPSPVGPRPVSHTPTHMTDFPLCLPQAPASDFSYQRGGGGVCKLPLSSNH